MNYLNATKAEKTALYGTLRAEYEAILEQKLSLDLSRGKPSGDQLALSMPMLEENCTMRYRAEDGFDCRNYGVLAGLPEMRAFWSELTGIPAKNIVVGGNSSLNMMFDTVGRAFCFGNLDSERPWSQEEKVKFLCPAPGYDRHFAICQQFNIKMIAVPMLEDGPDMDMIEELVANDAAIKGIWCVPKYSNPTGTVYSDEVVRRFAALKPKAPDFRIFWDNAYAVHDLYENGPKILNILEECEKVGNPNMVYMFSSTSKISYPGSGVAVLAASMDNIEHIKKQIGVQTIGPDKLNQLRHVRMFKNKEVLLEQMKKHAEILRPKFEAVLNILDRDLEGKGIATWSKPLGGYFVSVNAMPGCAKRIYHLCDEAGVSLTMVGATFPYGNDPEDSNIRLAPSYPPVSELEIAMERFTVCVRIACIEKLLADKGISAC